jgi:hypothetical protein
MAKAKDTKGKRPKKGDLIKAAHVDEKEEEVSALQAFLLSFIMLSVILAPVLGLGIYFGRSVETISSVFPTPEGTFLGGMLIGVLVAFVVSIIFTRRAVAQA